MKVGHFMAAFRALAETLEGPRAGNLQASTSFPVRDEAGVAAWVAHLLPIRRSAGDVFGRSFALPYFSSLAAGLDVDTLAAEGDVAISTVRSQLRQVLHRTGCTRQADVAALITPIGAREASSI